MVPNQDWVLVSNGPSKSVEETAVDKMKFMDGQDKFWIHTFDATPAISTYIFNLSVGDFFVHTASLED